MTSQSLAHDRRIQSLPDPLYNIPSPPVGWLGGHLLMYRRDPLNFLLRNAREYGDLVRIQLARWFIFQVNHPDDVQQVLTKQAHKFYKAVIYKSTLSEYLGNGLLVSDGDFWKRQRQLAQPAFHTKRIQAYADVMSEYTQRMLAKWADGQRRDIAREMMRLTLYIVAKTLFDADVSGERHKVAKALEVLLHSVIEESQIIVRLPDWVPTPARARKYWSIDTLHDITMGIIKERRASGEDKGDLLSMLLLAEGEGGDRMTDEQVRDEALTLFLAGHETTANALTWALYLLTQHPQIAQRLRDEVDGVLGKRVVTLADLPQLTYTEQVLKEAMRLYPPAWGFARQAVEDVTFAGYDFPKRTNFIIIPYVIHRDPRWFADPERFDPERFNAQNEPNITRYAYLPFGGGPRICIGNSFAMMEAKIILASIMQRFVLTRPSAQPAVPEALVTLRPKGGMPMRLTAR